jgi:hypothetical protein
MKPQIKIGQVWKFKESYGSGTDYYFVVNRITEQVIGFQYLHKDSTGWCFERDFHRQYELVSDV